MSQDLINRYKKTARLQFQNPETESRYRDTEETRGRSSSAFAFAALLLLCTAYAYLESRAFGHEVAIPMYGYILAAVAAAANLLLSRFSTDLYYYQLRLIGNGVLAMGTVVVGRYPCKNIAPITP